MEKYEYKILNEENSKEFKSSKQLIDAYANYWADKVISGYDDGKDVSKKEYEREYRMAEKKAEKKLTYTGSMGLYSIDNVWAIFDETKKIWGYSRKK